MEMSRHRADALDTFYQKIAHKILITSIECCSTETVHSAKEKNWQRRLLNRHCLCSWGKKPLKDYFYCPNCFHLTSSWKTCLMSLDIRKPQNFQNSLWALPILHSRCVCKTFTVHLAVNIRMFEGEACFEYTQEKNSPTGIGRWNCICLPSAHLLCIYRYTSPFHITVLSKCTRNAQNRNVSVT